MMKQWAWGAGLGAVLLAPSAMARVCAVTIDSTDQMTFSAREITLGADCTLNWITLGAAPPAPARPH